jgi:hypothetical protein
MQTFSKERCFVSFNLHLKVILKVFLKIGFQSLGKEQISMLPWQKKLAGLSSYEACIQPKYFR